jgi:hypothetical protein
MREFIPYGASLLKRNIQILVGVLYSITKWKNPDRIAVLEEAGIIKRAI